MSLPKHLHFPKLGSSFLRLIIVVGAAFLIAVGIFAYQKQQQTENAKTAVEKSLSKVSAELTALKNQDQVKRNDALEEEIANIQKTYKQAVSSYEELLKLKEKGKTDPKFDQLLAQALTELSDRKYEDSQKTLATLNQNIAKENAKFATTTSGSATPITAPASNTPPGSGYSRQQVSTEIGNFVVDIVAADMGSTRIIVDTASDATCANDCPVLSLGDYVARNGAFAGINGSYFCPAEYPSCQGKTNSFDTLLMNKNKVYFNSENNVYSTVPAVIFLGGSMRFVGRSSDWGRDTSPNGVLANQPLLLSGGNIAFGGDGDPKKGSKGNRSFVGNKGSIAYIGVIRNATVAEGAYVLKALGLENALNLDSGGSTALWSGGYKAGPGRNIPNAILFVR